MAVILSSSVEAAARASGLNQTIPLVAEEVAGAVRRGRPGRGAAVGDRSRACTNRSREVRFALLTVRGGRT